MAKRICRHVGCACEPAQGHAYCSEHCEKRDRVAQAGPRVARCGCNHAACSEDHDPHHA